MKKNNTPESLLGKIFINEDKNKRKRIEKIEGNHIIYSISFKSRNKWTPFNIGVFCCITLHNLQEWGNEVIEKE